MLKYEFLQTGEFNNHYYAIMLFNDDGKYKGTVGYLFFSEGKYIFDGYEVTSGLMIEIANKMEELDKSVKKQLFLGRF